MASKGEWPKEIAVCLECGVYDTAAVHLRNRRTCQSPNAIRAKHGPIQTLSVVPTSHLQELRDAAQGVLPDDGIDSVPVGFVEVPASRLRRLDAALKRADEVLGGGSDA